MTMLSLIVAQSENRVIGVGNRLPWHLPEDLKHFKKVTAGHPVIMGRKTFESIGRLLPGRTNIILSRQKNLEIAGAIIAENLEQAISIAENAPGNEEIFIIGGGEIFSQALDRAKRIYLTTIHKEISGDAFFPKIPELFKQTQTASYTSESTNIPFSISTWEKI